jgi:hypothetical protein
VDVTEEQAIRDAFAAAVQEAFGVLMSGMIDPNPETVQRAPERFAGALKLARQARDAAVEASRSTL